MAKPAHIIVFFMASMAAVGAHDVLLGLHYGRAGDNLPSPPQVLQLCLKYNIRRILLDNLDADILQAFRGSGIDISMSVPNDQLTNMKTNNSAVEEWFNTYVEPYIGDFVINYIIVGDNAIPGLDECILPVMKCLQNLLNARYLGQVKLTTSVTFINALAVKYPPSSGAFVPYAIDNLKGILKFLVGEGSPLMVTVYPYIEHTHNISGVSFKYAAFDSKSPVIHDGEHSYYNLFDAMMDTFYAAIDKLAVGDVALVVGETGWPSCGNDYSTSTLKAYTYNKNFKRHICSGRGTPRKRNIFIEGYIKSMFNENQLPTGDSRCYGVFNTDSTPIYPLFELSSNP